MQRLDRTEQRIVGVLAEKQLSVPDSYPMSENALVDGCNQKSNRDPVTELASFQVAGALMALLEKGFAARIDGAGRVAKWKHRLVEQLQVDPKDLAILAELLLRGPQAPGALKPRVARMENHGSLEEIEAALRRLAERKPPLVELLPLGPRERDRRWRHLLGDGTERASGDGAIAVPAAPHPEVEEARGDPSLAARVAALEQDVAALRAELRRLASPQMGD